MDSIHIQPELGECLYSDHFETDPTQTLNGQVDIKEVQVKEPIFTPKLPTYPETLEMVNERILGFAETLIRNSKSDTTYICVTHQRPVKIIMEMMKLDTTEVGFCAVANLSIY